MKKYSKLLDSHEDANIQEFINHIVLKNLGNLRNPELEHLLLQRAQLSFQFTGLYDRALRSVEDKKLQTALEWLVREEYPCGELNHRKALMLDLYKLGLSKGDIINTRPTDETEKTINAMHEALRYVKEDTDAIYDVKIATYLRFLLELSVGAEYGLIVPQLARADRGYEFTDQNSVFYVPHREHDKKIVPIGEKPKDKKGLENHTYVLGIHMDRLLDSQPKLDAGKKAINTAREIKAGFYDQFTPPT